LAILIGSISGRSHVVEKLWHPLTYLLFPLSGAAFMVDWLPPPFRDVVWWLPMVHGLEILRGGFFGSAVQAHFDLPYVLAVCLALTLVGLAQCRIVSRQVTPE
jgi:capsular polysaccharide transport system permease protein